MESLLTNLFDGTDWIIAGISFTMLSYTLLAHKLSWIKLSALLFQQFFPLQILGTDYLFVDEIPRNIFQKNNHETKSLLLSSASRLQAFMHTNSAGETANPPTEASCQHAAQSDVQIEDSLKKH